MKEYIVRVSKEDNVPFTKTEYIGELVRCKDCPLSKTDPNDYEDVYWCDFTPGRSHHSMDYCSEGARQKQMR